MSRNSEEIITQSADAKSRQDLKSALWAFCTDSYLKACDSDPCGPWLKRLDVKFIKFLFVGFLNTLFGYSMYAIGVASGLSYSWALLVSYTLGVFWNFKTTGGLVFKNKNNWLILKFCCVYVVTLSINLACLRLLVTYNVNKYAAQALLVLPVAILSFTLFKYIVFKKECEE